jgi:hypothetical protein
MSRVKTYTFKELNAAILAEVVTLRHERGQPAVWEELARREIGERQRLAISLIVENLNNYKSHRSNEATLWARAIYPLLVLAERADVRAFSLVSMAARFDDVELRGETDGALAMNIDEEAGLPYLVVIEAKRGVAATDPMGQLLGAMLCAARLNDQDGHPAGEMFGCYTIADVWTFVRGVLDWSQQKPAMSLLSSREYAEKTEAVTILAILASIVAKAAPL